MAHTARRVAAAVGAAMLVASATTIAPPAGAKPLTMASPLTAADPDTAATTVPASCVSPSRPMVWGLNYEGQVGTWGNSISRMPQPVGPNAAYASIDAGARTVYATTHGGSLWAWGRGTDGEIGNGALVDRNVPTAVTGFGPWRPVVQVSGGGHHALARTSDGSVWAWGENADAEVGDGTTVMRPTPVRVPGLGPGSGVIDISAGNTGSFVLRSDGSVLSWGRALVSLPATSTPTVVPGLGPGSGVIDIEAGGRHLVAIRDDGTAVYVGGYSGPVSSIPTTVSTATTVPGLTGDPPVRAVGAGDMHDLFLLDDGSVKAWGNNPAGELGDGTKTSRSVPVAVQGLTPGADVVAVDSGDNHSVALLANGSVLSWGATSYGQLGNASVFYSGRIVPGPVDNLGPYTGTISLTANTHTSAVLQLAGIRCPPEITSVTPNLGPAAGGTQVVLDGRGFTGTSSVTFGAGAPATSFHVDSDTRIRATTPPHAASIVSVQVTTPGGSNANAPRNWFRFT